MQKITFKILLFIFFIILYSFDAFPQTVYEPVNSPVYDFLERLTVMGVINFNSSIKPITRKEIAGYLIQADSLRVELTELERSELRFYSEEFADDIDIISQLPLRREGAKEIEGKNQQDTKGIEKGTGIIKNFKLPETDFLTSGETGRFRFFRYRDSSFTFYADPILGYQINFIDGKNNSHRFNGAELFGYYNNWGFRLRFRDNEESGDNIDYTKSLTPVPGTIITKTGKQSLQFDEVDAEVNYGWNTGVISVGKYYLNWGSGNGGQLILSDKAPSYPMIRLDFSPISWLHFIYIHGWLHSGIIDSSSYRYNAVPGRNTYSQIEKFIAAHMLTFDIPGNIDLSIGESIIYSDHLEPLYLIPVMFFRAADHYLQRQGSTNNSNTGDNAQMFGDMSWRWEKVRTKFYSTLFIDELSLENIFKDGNLSAIAYTVGAETADPVVSNSLFNVEYSRLNPFVYMNSDLTQTYTSYGYQLGHWIGSNGDQIYAKYTQWIERGLSAGITGWYVRKGKKELPVEQYQLPYPNFLYGEKLTWVRVGLDIEYEIFHNIFLNGSYSYSNLKDEDPNRTPDFLRGVKHSVSISASYGF